jgi:hypothetical protein
MLPPPAQPIYQPHLQQQPPSHFVACDQAHHAHVTSESPPERRGRSPLPNDVDVDSGDELPIIPPSTPVLPLASIIGSVSQAQSQSQALTATSLKRKYSAQGDQLSVSTLSSGKRQRSGGGVATLHSISQGVNTFNAQFGTFMNAATKSCQECQNTSPERRTKAQDVVQDEHSTYLNAEQIVVICDVFETNTHAVDTFLNSKKFEYCRAWVEMQLKWAGHQLDNTTIDNSQ